MYNFVFYSVLNKVHLTTCDATFSGLVNLNNHSTRVKLYLLSDKISRALSEGLRVSLKIVDLSKPGDYEIFQVIV